MMKLHKLSLKDKDTFVKYLNLSRHELAVYSFENIYLWKALFKISWTVIKESLCVFFQDNFGVFLYLEPLGKTRQAQVVKEAFELMRALNKNPEVSRIENIERRNLAFYRRLGYACQEKFGDYLCRRQGLVDLSGNKFKHKRANCNYFTKHYDYRVSDYAPKYKNACLQLYQEWAKERKNKSQDYLYCAMLEDAGKCLKVLLDNYPRLDYIGKVVEVEGKVKAFTFGYQLNRDTFCILFEVASLALKGLAQFIFREFCRSLAGYKYVNLMDDSGLENLKKVKLSYRPTKLIPAYIVTTEKPFLNADIRRSSATNIGGSAKNFGGNADTRRFHRRDYLRPSACNLRESALKYTFSVITI